MDSQPRLSFRAVLKHMLSLAGDDGITVMERIALELVKKAANGSVAAARFCEQVADDPKRAFAETPREANSIAEILKSRINYGFVASFIDAETPKKPVSPLRPGLPKNIKKYSIPV